MFFHNKTTQDLIKELTIKTADIGLQLQNGDGEMPSGHNGPHHHRMTPVRNTAHWAQTFLWAGYLSQKDNYLEAGKKALDIIISDKYWPMKGNFWQRNQIARDSVNGLIGISWIAESLILGSKMTGDRKYIDIATNIFEKHYFDERYGLWWSMDIDGSPLELVDTLNQQMWFACIASKLAKRGSDSLAMRIKCFHDLTRVNIFQRGTGCFILPIKALTKKRKLYNFLINLSRNRNSKSLVINKEIAYHAFTLLGIAKLAETLGNYAIMDISQIRKAIDFLRSEKYNKALVNNEFGYHYNVPGFEIPYAIQLLEQAYPISSKVEEKVRQIFEQQLNFYQDFEGNTLNKISFDRDTFLARFYEITRLIL